MRKEEHCTAHSFSIFCCPYSLFSVCITEIYVLGGLIGYERGECILNSCPFIIMDASVNLCESFGNDYSSCSFSGDYKSLYACIVILVL